MHVLSWLNARYRMPLAEGARCKGIPTVLLRHHKIAEHSASRTLRGKWTGQSLAKTFSCSVPSRQFNSRNASCATLRRYRCEMRPAGGGSAEAVQTIQCRSLPRLLPAQLGMAHVARLSQCVQLGIQCCTTLMGLACIDLRINKGASRSRTLSSSSQP